MKNDQEFINLILDCESIIKQKICSISDLDDNRRYNLMLDEIKGLMITIKQKKLNTKQYYLFITQMLDKNDPNDVIVAILRLNEFYCKYYQKL
ncbi:MULTISPECIES: hypothetical protein [Bacillus]|jgi:hypothetical protein|uniref:Uncharacterized protein n=1 Tax=Bacillus mycoides TaxID=1405 RepID=A0A2A7YLE0_BACMY|nr:MULTISPECIES: hypothetical protein [Bacillus cereus group]ETT85565.1 hypothetical protein C174_01744 [Bacillus mycoides FSL H7-687]OSM09551.1 hypothetical protein BTH38_30045 [Bacillus toyonensis]PEK86507.1 hypothetical protein CN600_28955 [Bacillus mycoides]WJE32371.1 hypothetical protein QRX95_00015 [Bacillus mycoides]VXC49350.1 conserved hypothetical protein [Bacillus mycoides]